MNEETAEGQRRASKLVERIARVICKADGPDPEALEIRVGASIYPRHPYASWLRTGIQSSRTSGTGCPIKRKTNRRT